MNKRHRPTTEEQNYGQELYEKGYKKGYKRCLYDRRRRTAFRDKTLNLRYGFFVDFLDDIISKNKRK